MKIELTTYYGLPALADEHGNYLTVNGDVAFYSRQEAAERAKRIVELKAEHPNMPDEWYERNADKGVPSVTDVPGHVMFRGERLKLESLQESYAKYGDWPGSVIIVADDRFCVYPARHPVPCGKEYWEPSSLADGMKRLQAWLDRDSAPSEPTTSEGPCEQAEPVDPVRVTAERGAAEPTCTKCGEPFDTYRRPVRHKRAVTCSNCREGLRAWLNGLEPPKGKPRMVYDEPPYESPKMNAMAKWHNRNTSVEASPGWEE